MSGATLDEQTLDLIYGCAVEPSLWLKVVNRVTSVLGGDTAAVVDDRRIEAALHQHKVARAG